MLLSFIILVVSVLAFGFYLRQLWRRMIPDSKFQIQKRRPGIDVLTIILLLVVPAAGRAQGEEPFRIQDSRFKIQDSRFKIQDSKSQTAPAAGRAQGEEPSKIQDSKFEIAEHRIPRAKLLAMIALHATGSFDAYSTHTNLCDLPAKHEATEMNPLLRPFAHSLTIYPAINIGDLVLDVWLLKARGPRNRKLAWAATLGMTGLHLGFGVNNLVQHNRAWADYRNGLQPQPVGPNPHPPIHPTR